MKAATRPRSADEVKILVIDGASGTMRVVPSAGLHAQLEAGDLVVVNDAATLPGSLRGRTERGEEIELRLAAQTGDRRWTAASFGRGSYRTPTEERPAPPRLAVGARLRLGEGLVAVVEGFRPETSRLLEIALELEGVPEASLARIWTALYRAGRPVQYAHVPEPLALWDVQNVYAGRPWAVEMPSAGRALQARTLLELERRGVEIARVTHAAGLSSIGDAALDGLLPLPERYEVTDATWEAIARVRKRGGRVVAIGTSTARALEGGARDGRRSGVTDLRIGPGTRRAIVDAVLTGVHDAGTSHHGLLGAFANGDVLARALARSEAEGLLGHELGDAWLVWGEPRRASPLGAPRPGAAPSPRAREPAFVHGSGTTRGEAATRWWASGG